MGKVAVILNPSSKVGNQRRLRQELIFSLDQYFGHTYHIHETQYTGHGIELSKELIIDGADLIIAAGGDGTINEVVNGILLSPKPSCELGIINFGSGGDLARTLKLPKSIADQVDLIATVDSKAIDIGALKCLDRDGKPTARYFINECQVGISAKIVDQVTPRLKAIWGGVAFRLVSFGQLFKYQSSAIILESNGIVGGQYDAIGVVISNGRFCGGGMQLTPDASLSDGKFDLVVLKKMNVFLRLYYFLNMLRNRHMQSNKILRDKIETLKVDSDPTSLVEADGELLGVTPISISIIDKAINLRC